MNFLKICSKVILFFVTMTTVLTIFNTFQTAKLVKMVEEMEPVEIEYLDATEPDPEVETEVIPESAPEVIAPRINCRLDDETQQMIVDKCEEYGIDFAFAMAVIYKESSFRPTVISKDGGDYGLMQINKINHQWLSKTLGITDFLDAEQNVTAGFYMLHNLFEKYNDPALVLMAYNMGESGAKKYWDKGIYTSDYAEKILQQAEIYKKEIKERMGENV